MTARRALTPAARGVSLAVLAALRGGRVDLADQADGSTLATSTAPDGTELLRAVLHMPVRGHDPRQLTLPAVAPVPVPAEAAPVAVPAEVPPAPVAVPAGEEREPEAPAAVEAPAAQAPPRDEHNGIAVGDVVSLDDEDIRVTVSDEYGWQGVTVATTPLGRPLANVHCDWDDTERVGDRAWRTKPTREKLRSPIVDGPPASKSAKKAAKKVAKPKAPKAPAVPEPPQGDDAPEVRLWIREAEWDGLDDATRTEFEEPIGGSGVDWQGREGWVTALVPADEILTALRGMASAAGITLHEGDELPAAKPKRAAKAAKARPARLTPEPEADALTRHGQRCVVAVVHSGGPWELVWCDEMPGQMTHDVAWRSVEEQAHRARRYDRGGHCAADTRDGAK